MGKNELIPKQSTGMILPELEHPDAVTLDAEQSLIQTLLSATKTPNQAQALLEISRQIHRQQMTLEPMIAKAELKNICSVFVAELAEAMDLDLADLERELLADLEVISVQDRP